MPFTLSHAAAALPFRKFKPIWPALVIGTFAPDLHYFIMLSDEHRGGHHFPDVLLFTLPVALVTLWLFEWVVKGPLLELLPSGVQRRLQAKVEPLYFWGWKRFGSIVFWIALGIATHLLWDQFTHSYSWLGGQWSFLLRASVPVPFLHPMPLAKVLQHGSTLVGFLILCVWFVGWYARTRPALVAHLHEFSPFVKVAVVFTMVTVALLIGYLLAIFKLAEHEQPLSRSVVIATFFLAMTFVFCIEFLIYGLAMTLAARWRRVPAPQFDETAR